MEDLVALDGGPLRCRRHGAQDPSITGGQLLEDPRDLIGAGVAVVGEIGRSEGDLGAGRRHEVDERFGHDVALVGGQTDQGRGKVRPHDALGAAEHVQRRMLDDVIALLLLGPPEAIHHELDVGRLVAVRFGVDLTRAGRAHHEAADPHLIEHPTHQAGFEGPGRMGIGRAVVHVDRPADRGLGAAAVEVVEAVCVVEHVRDVGLEPVELEQRVVTQGEQHVQVRHVGCQGLGQRGRGRIRRVVVEEVVLELVEHQEQLPVDIARPRFEPFDEAVGAVGLGIDGDADPSCLPSNFGIDRRRRVIPPRVDVGDHRRCDSAPRPDACPDLRDHAGLQDRALADAARAVQDGQLERQQVAGDQPGVTLAAEEDRRPLGVEGRQTEIGL